MKVLVVGGGGREHAVAWRISQGPELTELYCVPGNAGTETFATNVDLGIDNIGALALWGVEHGINLTVVGPEAPLAEGLVDAFSEHGLRVFGATREAARLESSKSFAKEVMQKAGVNTARGLVFSDYSAAKDYVLKYGAPLVVKADGLAAGKGVTVAETVDEALAALSELMVHEKLGASGTTVVIEEKLEGCEASIIALVDEEMVLPLVISQDYKRLLDNRQGPNTGGMGAISPTPVLADDRVEELVSDIFLPVVNELRRRGIRYTGFLYAGVMVDRNGTVRVLEFNCRLGDPETQAVFMRLQSDFLAVLNAAVDGKLSTVQLRWSKKAAACVVASSRGYPGKVDDGKVIAGLFEGTDERMIFHAGTKTASGADGQVVTKGGRVLSVSALGDSIDRALENAYEGIKLISFDGMHYREDIGKEGEAS